MTTYLITGGAGFIGGNLVHELLDQGAERVVNLDALTYAGNLETLRGPLADSRHVFVHGDIGDGELVARLLNEHRPDVVMNLAAESHVDRSIDGPGEFIKTNVEGTSVLLQACLEHWRGLDGTAAERLRVLHVSTDEVYGSLPEQGAFTERSPYAPNSPYAASKAAADHLVRAFHRTYGLPTLTTNCSNNYGPYQFPEKLIPLMILKALGGEDMPVYGDGANVRDWLYVTDHCRALVTVAERGVPGEVYNIGGEAERSNLEVVHGICDVLDERRPRDDGRSYREQIRFVDDRPGHDRRYAIDPSKIRRELGWRAGESFDSGLVKTIEWYLANESWCQRVRDGSYRGERLGVAAVR